MPPFLIADEDFRLGPVNMWVFKKARASLTTALTGTHNDLIFRARRAGVLGNSITIAYVDPLANDQELSIEVVGLDIIVNLATGPAGAITTTAAEIQAAIAADPGASSLVYAVNASGNDGTGVVIVLAETPLAGGSDLLTETFVGAMTEETVVNMSLTASPLTAHVTGTQPRDKVVSGGTFQITAGLKEITLANIAFAFPGCELIEGADGKQRLDFIIPTGQSLRQARGVKMQLRRLLAANQETVDPDEILTVPLCSPVDGDVALTHNVTDQQSVPSVYEAWPDSFGRVAFFGTEIL
jgi:hypothetical protein